jgi:hypothetical protein
MTRLIPRWFRQRSLFLLAAPAALFTGCSTPGVVQVSSDTYMVTILDRTGMLSIEPAKVNAQAINQAMEFAEAKGKSISPVSFEQHSGGLIGEWGSVEYRFKLVDKEVPQAKRAKADDNDNNQDVYAELVKLDDLRKKGILTEAEFASEKQKLLNRPK